MSFGTIKIQTGSLLQVMPLDLKAQINNEPVKVNQFVKVISGTTHIIITGELMLPNTWIQINLKIELEVCSDKTNCIDLSYLHLINYLKILR